MIKLILILFMSSIINREPMSEFFISQFNNSPKEIGCAFNASSDRSTINVLLYGSLVSPQILLYNSKLSSCYLNNQHGCFQFSGSDISNFKQNLYDECVNGFHVKDDVARGILVPDGNKHTHSYGPLTERIVAIARNAYKDAESVYIGNDYLFWTIHSGSNEFSKAAFVDENNGNSSIEIQMFISKGESPNNKFYSSVIKKFPAIRNWVAGTKNALTTDTMLITSDNQCYELVKEEIFNERKQSYLDRLIKVGLSDDERYENLETSSYESILMHMLLMNWGEGENKDLIFFQEPSELLLKQGVASC